MHPKVLPVRQNNRKGHNSTTKIMITQNNDPIQAIGERVFTEIPIVQCASDGAIYILIKNLPGNTASYIQSGKFEGIELSVFPEDYEKAIVAGWRARGFKCTYCKQSMEYMHRDAIIRYVHVINPETGVSIFLIPWFLLPRKKYPVTAYAYAAWYSTLTERPAGVRETAEVVKVLFGLKTFDPSTVSRTNAQMSRIFRQQAENDVPLSNQEPEIASTSEIIDWVTEALGKHPSVESIKNTDGMNVTGIDIQPISETTEDAMQTSETQRFAEQVDSSNNEGNGDIAPEGGVARMQEGSVIAHILGNIPHELAKVTKQKPRTESKRERRNRGLRSPRSKVLPPKRKKIYFIEPRRLKAIRNEFTRICKNIVLNAALICRTLLI